METEWFQIHDLVKEVQRSIQFISCKIGVESFDRWIEINGIIIDRVITIGKHDMCDDEIELYKKCLADKTFNKKINLFSHPDEEVDVKGKLLVLAKGKGFDGFVEIDVVGHMKESLLFVDELHVNLKDPIARDVVYVYKNYPNIHQTLLDRVKKVILLNLIYNPSKRYNLSRIIDFINKAESSPEEDWRGSYLHDKEIIKDKEEK
jgi:hypothetical protein